MKLARMIYTVIGVATLWFGVPFVGGAPLLIDRIVAVVNDDIITLSELTQALVPYLEQIKSRRYDSDNEKKVVYSLREKMLNQLIDEKLTQQEVKRAKIAVGEMEINAMIERIKESRYLTDEELRAALKQQGMSISDFRVRMKEQILRSKLVNREIKSKIVITQDDIQAYYEDHSDRFSGEKQYHLRNIFMKVPSLADASERKAVIQKMDAVIAELEKGASFADLARKYSQSPMAKDGGDLGTFKETSFSPQIQSEIRNLKKGDYTGILVTDQGIQIFFIEDLIHEKGKTLEDVFGEIRETLYKEIVDRQFKSWLEGLRRRSHIKVIK